MLNLALRACTQQDLPFDKVTKQLSRVIATVYFEGINFRGNAFRKVFADLIFVELGLFAACMHAILNSRF